MSSSTTSAPEHVLEIEEEENAQRTFSFAIIVSAIRCTLTYVVFPFVLPWLGFADLESRGWGPTIGVVIGAIAIISNVVSIKRMWAANHHWRKPVTAINIAMIVLVLVLVTDDVVSLLS